MFLQSSYKFSILCGIIGVVIGGVAFLFNYHMVPVSLPGYEVLAAPAMFLLSFFSEETYFTPKMLLYCLGQFIGYFCCGYIIHQVRKLLYQG